MVELPSGGTGVRIGRGRFDGYTVAYGSVSMPTGRDMRMMYDLEIVSRPDVPADESDVEVYFGDLLVYMMLSVRNAVQGTDWEDYDLE